MNRQTPIMLNLWRTATGLLLSLLFLALSWRHFLFPGIPFSGDGVSNLLPVLHVRHSLTHGQFPIYTQLWYGGEYQFVNPLWKGLYPPAWSLYIPGVPIAPTLKLLLIGHAAAAGAIAYNYASTRVSTQSALAISAIWLLPISGFGGHYEEWFAWPWFVLLAWTLLAERRTRHPRKSGVIIGASIGMMLLTGAIYYAGYAVILAGCVLLATRAWATLRGVLLGALIGVPKVVTVLPLLLAGADRPGVSDILTGKMFVSGLIGWPLQPPSPEGYALVSLPVLVVGLLSLRSTHRNWVLGVVIAGIIGLGFAFGEIYNVPMTGILRSAGRASILGAVAAMLLATHAVTENESSQSRRKLLTITGYCSPKISQEQ